MKSKAGPSFDTSFKAPHLFIEDLEEIEKIFKEDLKPKIYEIETEQYKYTSIDEVSKDNNILHRLKFSSYSPNIFIDFTPYSATIRSFEHSLDAVGAAEKISEVIRNRERKLYWFLYNRYIYAGWLISIAVWFIPKQYSFIFIILLLFLIPLLIVFIFRLTNLYNVSTIEFKSVKTAKNFVERNKDQILVNLITVSIGAILGVVGTIIAYYFKFLK